MTAFFFFFFWKDNNEASIELYVIIIFLRISAVYLLQMFGNMSVILWTGCY